MEINYAENQWNCYTDFIVSTHESTSSYNKWSIISGGAKFLVLVTEILFAGAAFLHLSVSFSRSMLTLGLLKNDRMEKLVDYVTWIICGLLMVLTVAARIRL